MHTTGIPLHCRVIVGHHDPERFAADLQATLHAITSDEDTTEIVSVQYQTSAARVDHAEYVNYSALILYR